MTDRIIHLRRRRDRERTAPPPQPLSKETASALSSRADRRSDLTDVRPRQVAGDPLHDPHQQAADVPHRIQRRLGHLHADRAARLGERARQRHRAPVPRRRDQQHLGLRRPDDQPHKGLPSRAATSSSPTRTTTRSTADRRCRAHHFPVLHRPQRRSRSPTARSSATSTSARCTPGHRTSRRPSSPRAVHQRVRHREHRKVAVIGVLVREALFKNQPALGKYIEINGIPFKVVGIFEDEGNEGEMEIIYLPITTAQSTFNGANRVHQIMFTTGDAPLDETEAMARRAHASWPHPPPFLRWRTSGPSSFGNNNEEFQRFVNLMRGIRAVHLGHRHRHDPRRRRRGEQHHDDRGRSAPRRSACARRSARRRGRSSA